MRLEVRRDLDETAVLLQQVLKVDGLFLALCMLAGKDREHRPAHDARLEFGAGIEAHDGGAVEDRIKERLIGIEGKGKRHRDSGRRTE